MYSVTNDAFNHSARMVFKGKPKAFVDAYAREAAFKTGHAHTLWRKAGDAWKRVKTYR